MLVTTQTQFSLQEKTQRRHREDTEKTQRFGETDDKPTNGVDIFTDNYRYSIKLEKQIHYF